MDKSALRFWLGRLDSFYVGVLILLNLPVSCGSSTALVGHSAEPCYKSATNSFTRPVQLLAWADFY